MFLYEILLNGKVTHKFTSSALAISKAEKLVYSLWNNHDTKADIKIRVTPIR